jgi:hypothetical protein
MRSIRIRVGALAVTGAIAALAAVPGLAAAAPAGACHVCTLLGGFDPSSAAQVVLPGWPLPPDPGPMSHFNPGDWVQINPQPLPPGAAVALNPQPIPPGVAGDLVSLNPQPLPPGPPDPDSFFMPDLGGLLAPGIG